MALVVSRFELGSVDVLLDLVEINMGISMLPNHVVQQKMQEGTIVRIDTDIPVPTRDICACAFTFWFLNLKGLQDLRPY